MRWVWTCVLTSVWEHGSRSGIALAEKVVELCENNATFQPTYDMSATIQEKVETIAKNVYGATNVHYSDEALTQLKEFENWDGTILMCVLPKHHTHSRIMRS